MVLDHDAYGLVSLGEGSLILPRLSGLTPNGVNSCEASILHFPNRSERTRSYSGVCKKKEALRGPTCHNVSQQACARGWSDTPMVMKPQEMGPRPISGPPPVGGVPPHPPKRRECWRACLLPCSSCTNTTKKTWIDENKCRKQSTMVTALVTIDTGIFM